MEKYQYHSKLTNENYDTVEELKAAEAKIKLYALGSYAAMMSGSGSSVFGLFKAEDTAKSAADSLSASGFKAFYAKSV